MQRQALSLVKRSRRVTQLLRPPRPLREVSKMQFLLVRSRRWGKNSFTPSPASATGDGWVRQVGSSLVAPPSRTPTPRRFPDPSFRRDAKKFRLDVRGLSPVLGSPVPPRRWESFTFRRRQRGFGAAPVAVARRGG